MAPSKGAASSSSPTKYMVQFLQTAQIMGEINKFWEGPIAK